MDGIFPSVSGIPPVKPVKPLSVPAIAVRAFGSCKVGAPPVKDVALEKPVEFKPGDRVEYNGKQWILRGINPSGFAQLTDIETGRKFPGTPRPDKLTLVETPVKEVAKEAPIIDDVKDIKRNRFIDDRQVDEIADIDIVENDEGLDDVDPDGNFKYLNNLI